jgi:hypothetical protein
MKKHLVDSPGMAIVQLFTGGNITDFKGIISIKFVVSEE